MKYRIKVTTYMNGRNTYLPQVRLRFWWASISYLGAASITHFDPCDNCEKAMERILKHASGNNKVQSFYYRYYDGIFVRNKLYNRENTSK